MTLTHVGVRVASAPPAPQPAPRRRRPRGWVGWLFLAPNLFGFLAFTAIPLVFGVTVAFTRWNVVSGIEGIEFVGLGNFTLLAGDPTFWDAVRRTLLLTGISVPATLGLAMLLALALNSDVKGRGALRLIFFLPHIVSSIAIGFVWLLLLHPEAGPLNRALLLFGVADPPAWLVSQQWALPALVLITIWSGVGFQALILVAALQSVPDELHEAAAIDGANAVRRFTTVTVPALIPTITFLLVMAMISQAQGFGLIAFLTQGGPGAATTTLAYLMYESGFQRYQFGYAAAVGMVSFVGVLVLTLLLWRVQRGRGLFT